VSAESSGVAWGSFAAGLASCLVLPVAVYLTRFSESYDLLHAGLAIPIAAALAAVALTLARRARARARVSLSTVEGSRLATAGRILGVVGLCMAASALVALGVYGLLEYVGSRD
jgi:hypothetical protein